MTAQAVDVTGGHSRLLQAVENNRFFSQYPLQHQRSEMTAGLVSHSRKWSKTTTLK
jgi:hypothetical protein